MEGVQGEPRFTIPPHWPPTFSIELSYISQWLMEAPARVVWALVLRGKSLMNGPAASFQHDRPPTPHPHPLHVGLSLLVMLEC